VLFPDSHIFRQMVFLLASEQKAHVKIMDVLRSGLNFSYC